MGYISVQTINPASEQKFNKDTLKVEYNTEKKNFPKECRICKYYARI